MTQHLLPRFFRRQEQLDAERKIARILLEADAEAHPDANGRVYRQSADGHRRDRRRGLPLVTRGVGGASPGTDPVAALLRKEARGEVGR